ncbi:MAG: putative metalloprotease CJM1_0395 family protein [Oleiphilus sp.]
MILPYANATVTDNSANGANTAYTSKNTNASSSELAKTSSNPSVNVQLSASTSNGALAAAVASIPPIYNKPTVNLPNQIQLSPSRNSTGTVSNVDEKKSSSPENEQDKEVGEDSDTKTQANKGADGVELTDEELEVVEELKARDSEVRAHEQAHKTAGGQYTGAISYSYQSGPDGKRYAVGGEVPIDVSPIPGDPQATIVKMNIVRSAATAPAQPSAQDQLVAAQASRQMAEAQAELVQEKMTEFTKEGSDSSDADEKEASSSEESYIENSLVAFQAISQIEQQPSSLVDTLA